MKPGVKELNNGTFYDITRDGVVLVDFWAPWCGPCWTQGPIVEAVATEVPQVTVAKCNVDKASLIARRLAIKDVPTLVVFKEGEEVERLTGLQQREEVMACINRCCDQ